MQREKIITPVIPHLFRNKISSYPTGGMLEKIFTPPKLILLRQRSRAVQTPVIFSSGTGSGSQNSGSGKKCLRKFHI
jgi:hypothetical protein